MLYTIGIVGTSGKSTTTWLTRHLLASAGYRVGLLSSVNNFYGDDTVRHIPLHLRHGGAPFLEYTLEEIERAACTHAVLELSVNEARLKSLPNIDYQTSIWTTLHTDDMDYTGDVQSNFQTKWKILQDARCAIVNVCDEWGKQHASSACLTYAVDADADWIAEDIREDALGSQFMVRTPQELFPVTLSLIGRHNISNALGAMAAASRAGVSAALLREHLPTFHGPPARMHLIAAQPVRVLVDFANTPGRLQQSLQSLRATTARDLIVVTGSPDDSRYVPDRAALGAVATRLADRVIFTEAGYLAESPHAILESVTRGASRQNYEIVLDRPAAIRYALQTAREGDTVLIAGKGTEETIARGENLVPWNEVEIVRAIHGKNRGGDNSPPLRI